MPAYVDPKLPKPGLPGEAPNKVAAKSVSISVTLFRYFHVSYNAKPGFMGDITFSHQGFPSAKLIRSHIASIAGGKFQAEDVVILFLSEFKSREDYEAFNK